jgi:hypothetical protein
MTTLNDLVVKTYRELLSSLREETDQLGASVGANATLLTLATGEQLGSITSGTILQVDWELFYVESAISPSSINVIPGYYDSTSTTHAANALITVNPRFPAVALIKAINDELDELSAPGNGLFQPLEFTIFCNPVLTGYDCTDQNTSISVAPGNLIDVLQIETHEFGPEQRWPRVPQSGYRLSRNVDTGFFPSGMSIKILNQANYFPGQPIRITYKAPFNISASQVYTPLANPTDDVIAVAGLHQQAHDILPLGAAIKLMAFREVKRSFTEEQPAPRMATEVPVGSSEEAIKELKLQRQARIDQERARLENQWQVGYL